VGLDISEETLVAARQNSSEAGVQGDIAFARADARELNAGSALGHSGLIVCNLPYGKRAGDTAMVRELYPAFGAQLRKTCRGWRFGLVVPRGAEKLIGLRTDSALRFVNGGIPVVFLQGSVS
jgi:23S rRNA G2445 N2-methylase RlmL